MKRSLLCNEPRIWKDCHFKASLESCRPSSLLTCQAGIKRPPIIISLFSNEPIVYLHLGWQPSRAHSAAEAREVAIQILHVLVGDSLQHIFKVFFFSLEMFVALGNSDLDLYGCQDFLPKKRQFRRFRRRKFWYAYNFGPMRHLLYFWTNPSIYPSATSLFHYLGSGRKRKKPWKLWFAICFFSFSHHFKLDLEHARLTVSLIQVLPQLLCREMLPPSCLRKTGLCPRPAVCHQLWASSEAGTLSPGSRGTLLRAFKNYTKSSNNLSKQRPLCKEGEKTQETDE